MRKYIIEATLKVEDTEEVLCRVSGYSMESFEEELGKIEKTLKRYQELDANPCRFCKSPATHEVTLRVSESPKDELGYQDITPLCAEHYADYEDRVGIFEPYNEK